MKYKIHSEEVKILLSALENLIEIKVLIRKITPNYDLDDKFNRKFLYLLNSINSKLQPIFNKYLTQSSDIKENKNKLNEIILDLIKRNSLVIVSANHLKRRLKNLGVDPRNLIVTGGPLFIENYKKINPAISNEALSNIDKKCKNLVSQIEKFSRIRKELIFLYKKDNLTDQVILEELDLLENSVKQKIISYEIYNLDDQLD